jgi:hypothetical protein
LFALKWKLVEVENGKRSGKEIPDRLQTLTGERIEVSLSLFRGCFWICMIFGTRDKVACHVDFY